MVGNDGTRTCSFKWPFRRSTCASSALQARCRWRSSVASSSCRSQQEPHDLHGPGSLLNSKACCYRQAAHSGKHLSGALGAREERRMPEVEKGDWRHSSYPLRPACATEGASGAPNACCMSKRAPCGPAQRSWRKVGARACQYRIPSPCSSNGDLVRARTTSSPGAPPSTWGAPAGRCESVSGRQPWPRLSIAQHSLGLIRIGASGSGGRLAGWGGLGAHRRVSGGSRSARS